MSSRSPRAPRRSVDWTKRLLTTYSMWSLFRNCRRAAYWRYVRGLVPIARAAALDFGQLFHACLEEWYRGTPLDGVLALIDRQFPTHVGSPEAHARWHLLRAMMRGYAARYPRETWRTLGVEYQFDGPIVRPDSGSITSTSRTFYLGGRVDGIVADIVPGLGDRETFWILEHKSSSAIDAGYLEKLWTDFQTVLYAGALERALGIPITGVVYNVVAKAKLTQHAGETEAEYQARYAEACRRNRSGKSSATRDLPEGDEDYAARLDEWYRAPERFHREHLIVSRDQIATVQAELWELTQQWLDCRRRDTWYQNTGVCFLPGRTCEFFPICSSNANPNVVENLYVAKEPHEELREQHRDADGIATAPPVNATATTSSAPPAPDPWDPATLVF